MESYLKGDGKIERHVSDSASGMPSIRKSPTTPRPLVSMSEIVAAAADVWDVATSQIITARSGTTTAPITGARACVVMVSLEVGYRARDIATVFQVREVKNLLRSADTWMQGGNAVQGRSRMLKLTELRAIVSDRTRYMEAEKRKQRAKFDDVNDARNALIRKRYDKGKGLSVKGLTKVFGIDPVEICDVLGLDRAFAKW